eukprot:Phypoly_transcript_14798.p1 GENE.Phypoly_transcript_14798~~Phypoly_transcript_14798.p1  ORF type:complete len:136 (-),score=5.58 Phypoly_transcript_14798:501-908(-)
MSSVSSSSSRIDNAVCIIDSTPATIYCCICEQYYCDLDNVNFHNSNPDLAGHMRLRLRPAPIQEDIHAPAPPSPLIQREPPRTPEEKRAHEQIMKDVTGEPDISDEEAKHIGEGIVQGAEAFGRGIVGGITGIVV